jgi:hypothetical protein
VETATRPPGSPWRHLCRFICREQGAKDAVMVTFLAIVVGALALQLGLGRIGAGPARGEAPAASLRT